METIFCPWGPAKYLIFSNNVPQVLYYAIIPGMLVAVFLSLFIFFNDRKSFSAKLLVAISLLFFAWGVFALILFATNSPKIVMLLWSFTILIEVLTYAASLYLTYVFFDKQDIGFYKKILIFLLLLPFIILLPTAYNLSGVRISDCTAIEGVVALYVSYAVEIIFVVWILSVAINRYRKSKDKLFKKQILFFTLGILFFLITFSSGNIIGSFSSDWVVSQYGYFGMPIFMAFLTYLIVKYHVFNIKLIAAQALIISIIILVGSQFFFIRNFTNKILTGTTLLFSCVGGYALVHSVKKEVQQREELAKLNLDLQKLIKSKDTLMHVINHKVKGAFTHSKYIFAEMLEGMFGDISPKLKEMAKNGLVSDDEGIATIDLVLNQASLQAGLIKFDMKPFDFKTVVEEIVKDKKDQAKTKGLEMEIEIKNGNYIIFGDSRWLKEAAFSFVDNAVKYVNKGKIIVGLKKLKEKQILFYVKDTGDGITDEDKKVLWTEGGRGKDSLLKNVHSTGYGLSGTKKVVEAHKGKAWVESEVGKGSIFYMELPLTQK
ncbi:MAG: hypothetical protein C0412_07980 [Flavobacterium sp.]|nr:hypothetical protein [Flavobacterium sp.]